MTLSYQLTFDDYREAHLGVRKKPSWGRRLLGSAGGWVLFVGLALMLWMLLRTTSPRGVAPEEPARPAAPFAARVAAASAATLLFGGLLTFFVIRQLLQPLPKPWTAPTPSESAAARTGKAGWKGLFGWVLFIGLAVMLFMLLQNRPRPAVPPPSASQPPAPRAALTPADFAIGIVPWGVAGVLLVIVTHMASERNVRRLWEAQQFLHGPESLEVTSRGVRFTESLAVRDYEWSYFPGYKETPNLFLLYVSPLAFHIIPKRAFASEAEMDAFRGVLMSEVKEGQFLERKSSFPVVQPAGGPPPLPRPALPVSPAPLPEAHDGVNR